MTMFFSVLPFNTEWCIRECIFMYICYLPLLDWFLNFLLQWNWWYSTWVSNMRPWGCIWPANYFSTSHLRAIFVIDILLKLSNLSFITDLFILLSRVENTCIFQSHSLQYYKLNNRNNYIFNALKTFLITLLGKSALVCFKDLLW